MAQVLAVCVVHELRPDDGRVGVTAIDKRPVSGRVPVLRYGLRGDVQADRKNHGGLDQAIYAYSTEDAAWWGAELGRELPAGWFGENLRIDGMDVSRARPGERWLIGNGEESVEVEVTVPRNPCMTFARWVGGADTDGWVKRFADAGRLGMYVRVLRTGSIGAGDTIEVLG